MKRPQFKHVRLRTETRSDNGKDSHVITWRLLKGKRQRRVFSDEADAIKEASRIDALLARGREAAAELPSEEHSLFIMLCAQVGAKPHEVYQFYIAHHHANGAAKSIATLKEIGDHFKKSRSSLNDFSERQISGVRQHINRFVEYCTPRGLIDIKMISEQFIKTYLGEEIGGVGKTQLQHLITLTSWFRWARDIGFNNQKFLPYGRPTAAEQVTRPKVVKSEHEVYTPEQFTRLLIFTPTALVKFMVLGQFGGIRSEERLRLRNSHWRQDEDNKIVCGADVTKTNRRRRVDVEPNLAEWLSTFNGKSDEQMVPCSRPYKKTPAIAKAAGVPWLDNAFRAGYCSYHQELHDDAALTARNAGHTVEECESTYKSITGVTKKTAKEMFSITPKIVLDYATKHGLPTPEWVDLVRA